jgi:hypothetical protein
MTQDQHKKKSLRDKIRTRILRTDPRSASEGVDRTPIAIERQSDPNSETPVQVIIFQTLLLLLLLYCGI